MRSLVLLVVLLASTSAVAGEHPSDRYMDDEFASAPPRQLPPRVLVRPPAWHLGDHEILEIPSDMLRTYENDGYELATAEEMQARKREERREERHDLARHTAEAIGAGLVLTVIASRLWRRRRVRGRSQLGEHWL